MSRKTDILVAKAASETARKRLRKSASDLPPELLSQAVVRLRKVVLIYAFIFFMANFGLPLFSGHVDKLFVSFGNWGPGVVSILAALAFWVALRKWRAPATKLLLIGLAFEVMSCYGIAFAETWSLTDQELESAQIVYVGLSWVAPWILSFAVIVPNSPRNSFIAALISGTSVPVVMLLAIANGAPAPPTTGVSLVVLLAFPYVLVAILAYLSALTVYGLGTEVRRAQEMGSYRLQERLGQGGMGEVWLAEHRMLARPAAVKLIRTDALQGSSESTEHTHKRFEREAKATARLRSPHTVELYDYGRTPDGTCYYVMEFLEGLDFETLIERFGPLPAERVIHLLVQACESLEDAHSSGLLHRDIKPANMFTCKLGTSHDFVKVLDFGLVKAQGAAEADETKLTADGMTTGTPAYMAPEVALGDSDVDHRADLYSLACVGYWLLTGVLVFEGSTPMKVLLGHTSTVPTLPSERTELPIPIELEDVIMKCLAKSPADRPESARALADALTACPVGRRWTQERAAQWWQHHMPASIRATTGSSSALADTLDG